MRTTYKGLVINHNENIELECEAIFQDSGNIEVEYIDDIEKINLEESLFNYLFILITSLNETVLNKIVKAQMQSLGLPLIFYNHSLNYIELPDITIMSKVKMIIGENRRIDLLNLLARLKKNYWRKIPYAKLDIDYDHLSDRMKKVMAYIEFSPISECNITSIAGYLNISPGYFSQEFKRETNKSFRTFMQNVINYYEDIILSRISLPTKHISQMLGYSELSSFSRSFKKRKGISPSKYKKMVSE